MKPLFGWCDPQSTPIHQLLLVADSRVCLPLLAHSPLLLHPVPASSILLQDTLLTVHIWKRRGRQQCLWARRCGGPRIMGQTRKTRKDLRRLDQQSIESLVLFTPIVASPNVDASGRSKTGHESQCPPLLSSSSCRLPLQPTGSIHCHD